jgi:hypothetical protein
MEGHKDAYMYLQEFVFGAYTALTTQISLAG